MLRGRGEDLSKEPKQRALLTSAKKYFIMILVEWFYSLDYDLEIAENGDFPLTWVVFLGGSSLEGASPATNLTKLP